ncbi:unnamed protein product [Lampetra planeri]
MSDTGLVAAIQADECGGVGGVGGDDGNRRGGGGGGGGGADGAEGVSAGCAGCGRPIRDAFLLRVWPDLRFHAACLRCAECRAQLHEARSCFVRAGRTFCQRDYNRLFGVKCSRCSLGLSRTELVMRVRGRVYHLACFRCWACARRLLPGDEVSLRPAGELLCRAHSLPPPPHHHHHHHHHHNHHHSSGKASRVRTVLTERQLQTLRTCYAANPRPDALLKEQLVEMTGLSPRVIRVWFQNKRCKDKKRTLAGRHDGEPPSPDAKTASLSDSGSCSDSSSASDVTLLPSHLPDTPTSLASDLCSES